MRKSRNSLRVGISLSLRITFFTGGLFSVRRNSFGGSAVAANFLSYRNDTHSRFISVIRQTVSSAEGNATRRRESRIDRIGGRFPGNMWHTGPLYSPRRMSGRPSLSTVAVGLSELRMPRGGRVETVSREREPSTIRDPAKWTVPGTFGYC